ncbi:ATP-binding protein [Streptomyces sp. NPDC094143]|uniref:ATP-binding protein n=1 Tax=Streptomyces sp. NPDC094143 TaxID=3155310 RepID=UPI003325EF02
MPPRWPTSTSSTWSGKKNSPREVRRFSHALRLSWLPHYKTIEVYDFSYQPKHAPRKVKDLATARAEVAPAGPDRN